MKKYLAKCLAWAFIAGVALSARADAVEAFVKAGRITFTGTTIDYIDMPDGKPQEGVLKWTNTETPGTLHIDPGLKVQAEILVVGGGGAGGTPISSTASGAGGGGAGGVILMEDDESVELAADDYKIYVGRGGIAALEKAANAPGENGYPSSISNSTETAYRFAYGGGGGGADSAGKKGGSGGGSTKGNMTGGGVEDENQGNLGGAGGSSSKQTGGAGGGGAGGVGSSGVTAGGVGGAGIKTDIAGKYGDMKAYAGGGGGGKIASSGSGADGGSGIGGTGGSAGKDAMRAKYADNTGSGGGGGGKGTCGSDGEDGVVIIRLVAAYDTMVDCPVSVTKDWNGYYQDGVDTTSIAYDVIEGVTATNKTGAYTYKVKPKGDFKWRDSGGTEERSVTWYIVPKMLEKPTIAQAKIPFDGLEHNAGVAPNVGYVCDPSSATNGVHAKVYSFTVKLNNPPSETNYVWKGESARLDQLVPEQLAELPLSWEIAAQVVRRPEVKTELVYNGARQNAVALGEHMKIVDGGRTNAMEVADEPYAFTVILDNPEGEVDYVWDNGEDAPSSEPYEVQWKITRAPNEITSLSITGWRAGATPNQPKATATWREYDNKIAFKYASAPDASEEAWTSAPPKEPGKWYVKAFVKETKNYAGAERVLEFVVWDDPNEVFADHIDISIKGYTGSSTLKDFPLAIRLSEARYPGFSYARAGDGNALAFILGDLMLDYEVEQWNPNGESIVWVRIPELTSKTELGMWWRLRPGQATSGPNASAVWSNYVGVWHMGETITASKAGSTKSADSTGNGLDATPNRGSVGTISQMISVDGVLGNARVIEGESKTWGNHLVVPNYDSYELGGQFVFSTWTKFDDYSDTPVLVSRKANQTSGAGWAIEHLQQNNRKDLRIRGGEGTNFTAANVFPQAPKNISEYTHLLFAYDGTTVSVYANGVLKTTGTITAIADNGRELYLGGGYSADGTKSYSLQGKLDETRLRKGTLSADWAKAEYESVVNSAFTSNTLVFVDRLKVNYWLEQPDVQPRSVDLAEGPADFAVAKGRLAEGEVAVRYYSSTKPDELLADLNTITEAGTYYAEFTMADGTGYAPVSEKIELRVYAHTPIPGIGGSNGDSGRVLLMNRDAIKTCTINYQGYYDTSTSLETYWQHLNKDGFSDTSYNLQDGSESMLIRKSDGWRLWHLSGCRHGNTFPKSNSAVLSSEQNYLPWVSSTAFGYDTRSSPIGTKRNTAAWLVMQNVVGASVYSSCFEDGIGTIYFDAVNGWTSGESETGENYKLRIEYATTTSGGMKPTDENCAEGELWYKNLETSWQPVPSVTLFKRDGTPNFVRETVNTNVFALAIKNGGTVDNFYRVAVTLNITQPVRFRIVRETYDSRQRADQSALIVLDNIIASIPPIGVELEPTGAYDAANTDKRGVTLLGQEMATTVPFPAVGEKNARARAKRIIHESALQNLKDPATGKLPDPNGYVSSAKMHYRWRYLNQDRWDAWKEIDLNPMADFVASTPLEIPEREGDIEFWFDADLKTPYYEYVDYSGTGLGVPMSEEIKAVTNHLPGVNLLPSAGTDWFFRLRRGVSASEAYRVIVETAESNAYGRVNLEVVGDHLWRGFLITTNAIPAGLRFRLEETAPADPASAEYVMVTNCWQTQDHVRELPASMMCTAGSKESWKTLVCDASTGHLQFQLDDSGATRTLTISHADRQDFNRWHDAHKATGLFVGNSTQSDRMSGVSSKMRDYPADPTVGVFSTWTDTPATDQLWREAFNVDNGNFDTQFPTFIKFASAATPNHWIAGPGMWVTQKWQKKGGTKESEYEKSGAYQMEGQGKGYLEYPSMARDPRGIESVTYKARLAQEIQFGDFGWKYVDNMKSMTNYTFVSQVIMSATTMKSGSKVDGSYDFDGAGQVSVVACYRPMIGCYEFRVTRAGETEVKLELYKWTSKNGVMKAELLKSDTKHSGGEDMFRSWRANTSGNPSMPVIYISVDASVANQVKVQAGFSTNHASVKGATQKFRSLTYWDTNPGKLTFGSYGVASANCNAYFVEPYRLDQSVIWAGGTETGANATSADITLSGTPVWEGGTGGASNVLMDDSIWIFEDGRLSPFEGAKIVGTTYPNVRGIKADVVPQELVFEYRAAGSGNWVPLWTNTVSGFTLSADQTKSFYRTPKATYRLRHNGTVDETRVDVTVDEVEIRQWGGDSFGSLDTSSYDGDDDAYGWRDQFVMTSGWVKDHVVELNAKRTTPGKPSSIRSPLMDGLGGRGLGLGMISFKYKNVNSHAKLLVQIATNNVAGTAIDETQSIEPGVWTTVTNFPASVLGSSGSQTVFLGLHGARGLMRIALDPATVEAAQESTDSNYGRIDITEILCRDEPTLDFSCWWGWNLRTFGSDASSPWDDGSRTYLADFSYEAGERGLSLALNNSMDNTVPDEEEYYRQHMPFVQTPTFVSNLVGEVTFRARMFDLDANAQKAEVRLYGASKGDPNIPDDAWVELAHFVVSNTYYETYHFRAPSQAYRAFRLGVSGIADVKEEARGEAPTEGPRPVRVMIEDVVVSEAVYPRLGFRYVYPVRTFLSENTVSPAYDKEKNVPNRDEQPLVGENWTIQAEIVAKQLPDEIDLETPSRRPRVYFRWFEDELPWGYENWRTKTDDKRFHTAELAPSADDAMVYRGSFTKAPAAIANEATRDGEVVQYVAEVVYYDKKGEVHTNELGQTEWTRPYWYDPRDLNAGRERFSAFSIFETIAPGRVWFNEVNVYDGQRSSDWGKPADGNQYVEIAVPAGQSLKGWRLDYVNNSLNETNTLCVFGDGFNEVKGEKRGNETNDYVFIVVQSPATRDAKTWEDEKLPDGSPVVIDGTWKNFDGSGGILMQDEPIALRLVRPSQIVEQEIALEGKNIFEEMYIHSMSLENFVKRLNAGNPAALSKYYAIGNEKDNEPVVGLEGLSLDVIRGTGMTSNDWSNAKHQTPGWCNEGQEVPEDFVILPNGAMIVVTAKLDGSGFICQTFGEDVETHETVRATTMKGGEGTNIVYFIDTWYERAGVTTNAQPVADLPAVTDEIVDGRKTGRTMFTLNVGRGCSNNITVVASVRPHHDLAEKYELDENNRYTEAVLSWLRGGQNFYGDKFENPGEIHLANYYDYLTGQLVTNLTLTTMYWLDMDPTSSDWDFVAGVAESPRPVSKPTIAPVVKLTSLSSITPPGGEEPTGDSTDKNIRLKIAMYMTNRVTGASYSPYILRGVTPGSTSESFHADPDAGNWNSATFKITGDLQNGMPMRQRWVPLRWFYFLPTSVADKYRSASFDENHMTVVDVWDPFDTRRSGATQGWDQYKGCPVFYKWAIDTRNAPMTVEPLYPDSTFKSYTVE